MNEFWIPIKGYEGLYEISNTGKVKTLGNFPKLRNRVVGILKGGNARGYLSLVLTDHAGKRKAYLVHRLVAISFLENPNNFRCVNHKDEDKENNHVDNLEWCTDLYNKEYSSRKIFILKSPTGEIVETKNLSRFCRENSLLQGNMSKVTAGNRTFHRGWSMA